MCKTCQDGDGDGDRSSTEVIQSKNKRFQARMRFHDERKKGMKGEHKGLPWKEAIAQTILLLVFLILSIMVGPGPWP